MEIVKKYLTLTVTVISLIVLAIFHEKNDFAINTYGPEIEFSISNGASGSLIAQNLEDFKVIKQASVFVNLYGRSTKARSIAPGLHRINTHLSTQEAVLQLTDIKRIVAGVNVKEGSTFSDVLRLLKVKKNSEIKNIAPAISNPNNSLEGQLQPAIYSFESGTSNAAKISQMVAAFKSASETLKLSSFDKYSIYQVLTIASLIQVEGDMNDFSKVARVIYNRLKINMPLQLNSSVQYGINLRGQIALSKKATTINTPYNTYLHTGLPPTPICNPSAAAILAAMRPAQGDWLYFITVKPKDTRFTSDFKIFSDWNTEYNSNLAKGLFK